MNEIRINLQGLEQDGQLFIQNALNQSKEVEGINSLQEIKECNMKLLEENKVYKLNLENYINENIKLKYLLSKAKDLIEKFQKENQQYKDKNLFWADEAVRRFREHGNFEKAMQDVGHEIVLYELSKHRRVKKDEDRR